MRFVRVMMRGLLGLVLLSHGLIHLLMPTVWSGNSPVLSGFVGSGLTGSLVDLLLVMTIICYAVAAGGLVRIPVLRSLWMEASVLGSMSSLTMFA